MSESKLFLKENPTLKDYQNYIHDMVTERGFAKESVPEIFMLMSEEVGELAKAVRKATGIHTDPNSEKYHIAHEAADILMYLLDICNVLHIDLEQAFREKEEINKKRVWVTEESK